MTRVSSLSRAPGQRARAVGHRGDDQGAIGQALGAGDANRCGRRRSAPGFDRDFGGVRRHGSVITLRGKVGPASGEAAASRRRSSSGVRPTTRNRFCREVSPERRAICDGRQPRLSASTAPMAALALPFSGGAVTATRSAPRSLAEDGISPGPGLGVHGERSFPGHGPSARSCLDPFEQRGAHPHQGRPFLDRGLEIAGHAHRQLGERQARSLPQRVARSGGGERTTAGPSRRPCPSPPSSSARRSGCSGTRRSPRRRRGSAPATSRAWSPRPRC